MADSRRHLSCFAVIALVLLRLVIGWHFWIEGTKKVEYDRHESQLRLSPSFSAEGFLTQAKGPLAELFHAQAPDDHGYATLLATPRQNVQPTADELAQRAKWQSEYNSRRSEAEKAGSEVPLEFPPSAPYHAWATRVAEDWRRIRDEVKTITGLADEQRKQADIVCNARLQELANYLTGETEAMIEYQHELWRLANWRSAPESAGLPFHDERVAAKTAETTGSTKSWLGQVQDIEKSFQADLRALLTAEQRGLALTTTAMEEALTDKRHDSLRMVNITAAAVTIGVGVCLLLGFFTRLASLVGALFLASVIASQPPWLAESAPTMSQCIELAGLLVLAGTGAGRWAGLDYFTHALFHRGGDEE